MENTQAKQLPATEDAHDDLCERIEVDIGVGIQTGPCYCDYRSLENRLKAAVAALAESEERETMRLAGISTAAMGYWKKGDSVHPDYVTTALHDVADLYAKYAEVRAFNDKLLAHLDEAKIEANRYQWLRDEVGFCVTRDSEHDAIELCGDALDAAIDDAIKLTA